MQALARLRTFWPLVPCLAESLSKWVKYFRNEYLKVQQQFTHSNNKHSIT